MFVLCCLGCGNPSDWLRPPFWLTCALILDLMSFSVTLIPPRICLAYRFHSSKLEEQKRDPVNALVECFSLFFLAYLSDEPAAIQSSGDYEFYCHFLFQCSAHAPNLQSNEKSNLIFGFLFFINGTQQQNVYLFLSWIYVFFNLLIIWIFFLFWVILYLSRQIHNSLWTWTEKQLMN